jgi:hypothetical protein
MKIGLRLRAAFVKVIDHDSWHKLYHSVVVDVDVDVMLLPGCHSGLCQLS